MEYATELLGLRSGVDTTQRGFRATIRKAATVDVPLLRDGRPDVPLFPVLQTLGSTEFGTFETLDALIGASFPDGLDGGGLKRTRFFFECLFVDMANARLQALYRSLLGREPALANASSAERLDHLARHRRSASGLLSAMGFLPALRWLGYGPDTADERRALLNLSTWFFTVKRLNFRFTYHCNAKCGHCYNWSGPDRKGERIDDGILVDLVRQMPGVCVFQLNITGGEPFLYLDTVCSLISECRKNRIQGVSIVTNGFWAASDEKCERVLNRLKEAGFSGPAGPNDSIRMSTGEYHREFIDLSSVYRAARLYHKAFGKPLHLAVEVSGEDSPVLNEIRRKLTDLELEGSVVITTKFVCPVGRATLFDPQSDGHEVQDGMPEMPDTTPCPAIKEIVFDADGKIRPCCGFNYEHDGVVLGRLGDPASLTDIMMRLQNDPVLQAIATRPVGDVMAAGGILADTVPDVRMRCIACGEATGNPANRLRLDHTLTREQQFFPFRFDGGMLDADANSTAKGQG